MRSFLLAAVFGLAGFGFLGANKASAQYPGMYGGYYGNGAHDLMPHLHATYTPFGPRYWYGNGLHDVMPHNHTVTPWGGVRSYNYTPFGPTASYNGFPGYGGFGAYPGYYSPWRW